MAPDRSKILDRIVKLFRLGSADANTTEQEMHAAITAAKAMMARHNISQVEVYTSADPKVREAIDHAIQQRVAYTRKILNLAIYDHMVALAVEILTGTKAITCRTRRGAGVYTSMQFIGAEADAALACDLFILILESIRRAARFVYGGGWSAHHTSYALGFATRLRDRAKYEEKLTPQESQSLALVVTGKQQAIARYMAGKKIKDGDRRSVRIQDQAYAQGYQDGVAFNLSTHAVLRGQT